MTGVPIGPTGHVDFPEEPTLTEPTQPSLFDFRPHRGRRVVVTGQVGVDKKPFLERVVEIARERGRQVDLCNVGDMMYAEAPDVVPGRILDLSLGRLNSLRRAVFKDVLQTAKRAQNLIVNTHATFRWRHGLFPAFDHDQLADLAPDFYVTLVDDVDAIHDRLVREHDVRHSLKDVLVWREEEILATEVLASITRGYGRFYIMARGVGEPACRSLYRLMFEPHRKRAYLSFPMTHVVEMPRVLAEIDAFRDVMADAFITFDPGDLDEKRLLLDAERAASRGCDKFSVRIDGRSVEFDVREVQSVAGDIDGQIYARDFKLIDQSAMIVSYIPELADGKPGLSSGVERELQHAFEGTKEVYVIWRPATAPSPFVTETATRVFRDVAEAVAFFQQRGYVGDTQMPLPGGQTPVAGVTDA